MFKPFAAIVVFTLLLQPLKADQPNVLLILADDLGFSDLGCYGGEIQTPNLDALAHNGLRFTQFYNTARCWPTRAAVLTGYYAQQVGRDALPDSPGGARNGRPAWAELLPRMLQPLGYRSYLSGKWHLDSTPIREGFDHSFTMDDQNRLFYPTKTTKDDITQPPIERDTDYYSTTAIANHAIECLSEHAEKYAEEPFFHYLAFTCPHFPLHAPAADIAKYREKYNAGWDAVRQQRWSNIQALGIVQGRLSGLEPTIGPPYDFPDAMQLLGSKEVNRELPWQSLTAEQRAFQAAKMEVHAAMVDRMDQEIGRVIAQLKAMGSYENTLIMFLSDNGASAEIMVRGDGQDNAAAPGSADTYLCLGPGWSSAANTPFRRHKTWVHEGGIATPLLAHWPEGIADPGSLRTQVGHVIDLAPTIVELAGGTWPTHVAGGAAKPPNPGISLVETIQRETATPRTLWWLHEGNRALRRGNFKLVAAKDDPWELYDLASDRAEEISLTTGHPETAKELEEEWNRLTEEFTTLVTDSSAQPSSNK